MAQHGYLREGYGMPGDFDAGNERGDDRQRGRMERGRDRRDEDDSWSERGPRFLFGDDERERSRERGMSHYGAEHGYGGFQGDFSGGREQGGFGGAGDYSRGRSSFSSHPDDHYRSWRQKQIDALDRDYEEYCREREQQFHQSFDSWRRNRQQGQQGGPSASGGAGEPDELLLKETATTNAPQEPVGTGNEQSPATLGTVPGGSGRGRR